jgi:hypothetical protein
MAQTQVFLAAADARLGISRTAYILFAVGVGLVACAATVLAVSFASGPAPPRLLITASVGLGCAGGVGLLAGLATLFRLRQHIRVEVTPHRLTWREGRRIATLEYEEVERVELVRGSKGMREGRVMFYPVVRFIEDDGEMMEFEVSFEDRGMFHHARFDARAITGAVIPHLRQRALVAQAVEEFVRTGTVDIDRLPER